MLIYEKSIYLNVKWVWKKKEKGKLKLFSWKRGKIENVKEENIDFKLIESTLALAKLILLRIRYYFLKLKLFLSNIFNLICCFNHVSL